MPILSALDTTRTMASALGSLQSQGASRKDVNVLLRDILDKHPEIVGLSTGWEPDAFDGQDRKYAGTPGHDRTGRLIPYWYRDGDALLSAPLTDYETPGVGDWYLVPRETGKEAVTDPYLYTVGDEEILMTTTVAPILVDGEFAGVATIDIGLDSLSAAVAEVRPYDTGYAALVTGGGTVVAHPDADRLGTPLGGNPLNAVQRAASGGHAVQVTGDDGHLDQEALTVFQPVPLGPEATWVLVVSAPTSSVLASVASLRTLFIALAVIGLLVAAALAALTARAATRPIVRLRKRLAEIASGDGDLTQRVEESAGNEVGELGAEFNRFTDKIADLVVRIQGCARSLSTSADGLGEVSVQLSEAAEQTADRTRAASESVGEMSTSVHTVAAGSEQMGASIREIATSATDAAQVGQQAVGTAEITQGIMSKLEESSAQIGDVVKVITSIAGQTNLLALNATIEAARAGDAGKGFAVVAGEVKDLAQETAKATEHIATLIGAIQADTSDATGAIAEIRSVIGQVNDYQNTIASAVEEQTATTQEMARGASDAAGRTERIAAEVVEVAEVTQQTRHSSQQVGAAAEDVASLATQLQDLVGHFRVRP
jgi:methyl-accepting chemotaxis protein